MLALGRDVRAAHGGGRRAAAEALARASRDADGHPGGLPRRADLHDEGRLVGPGRAAGPHLESVSRDAGRGAPVGAQGEGARLARDQGDARRHGLVPRAEARACRRWRRPIARGPDRGGAGAGDARDRARARTLADAKAAIAAGATALAHGVLDPLDDATIAVDEESRPVFYIPTMDIFEFLADTRELRGRACSPIRAASRPDSRRPDGQPAYRSPSTRDGYRERYPNFENRAPSPAGRCARTSGSSTPPACRSPSEPTCGRSRASASRSRWTSTSQAGLSPARGDPRGDADGGAVARRRGGPGHARARQARGLRWSSGAIPSRTSRNLRAIEGVWKAGERVGPAREQRP